MKDIFNRIRDGLKTTRGQLWIAIFLLAFIAYNLVVLNRNYFFPEKKSNIHTRQGVGTRVLP